MSNLVLKVNMIFFLDGRSLFPKARFHSNIKDQYMDLLLLEIFGKDRISGIENYLVDLVVVNPKFAKMEISLGENLEVYQGDKKIGQGTIIDKYFLND